MKQNNLPPKIKKKTRKLNRKCHSQTYTEVKGLEYKLKAEPALILISLHTREMPPVNEGATLKCNFWLVLAL